MIYDVLHVNSLLSYVQSKHDLKGKDQLLVLIRRFAEGLAVVEVKDAYPTVMEDLQVILILPLRSCVNQALMHTLL